MCSKRGRGLLSEDQSPASELELETPPVVRFAGESGALHVETGAAVAGSSTRRRAPTRVSIVLDHYATRLGSDTTYCARIMAQPPSRAGICTGPPDERCKFVMHCWVPFLTTLDKLGQDVQFRAKEGFLADHRFTLRGRELFELQQRNLGLTERWYGRGRGNICALYRFFVSGMVDSGVVAFRFQTIPLGKSDDGFAECVDTATRSKAGAVLGTRNQQHVSRGGMSQKQGESAIDNTVLVNVLSRGEARRLLAGHIVRNALVHFLRLRQKQLLRRVAAHAGLPALDAVNSSSGGSAQATGGIAPVSAGGGALEGGLLAFPNAVRAALGTLTPAELERWGIDNASPSWRSLLETGNLLADWGQLPVGTQFKAEDDIRRSLLQRRAYSVLDNSKSDEDQFSRLLRWCREHPGRFLDDNRKQHMLCLVAGLWSNRIAVITRSMMERLTLAKYAPISWTRQVPLVSVEAAIAADSSRSASSDAYVSLAQASGRRSSTTPTSRERVLRRKGVREHSRIRANECPYFSSHGMSICGGGFLERDKRNQKLSRYSVVPSQSPASSTDTSEVSVGMRTLQTVAEEGSSHAPPPASPLPMNERASQGMRFHVQQLALLHELNLPVDPSQRLGNWHLHDIEKVMQEAKVLAPCCPHRKGAGAQAGEVLGAISIHGLEANEAVKTDVPTPLPAPQLLPGDECYNVGQNPQIGSSIGATQHTQVVLGSLNDVGPVYRLPGVGPPQPCAQLCDTRSTPAVSPTVELVQVAESPDSIFVRITCLDPTARPLLQFLSDLRVHVLKNYVSIGSAAEGAAEVPILHADFITRCFSDSGRRFVCMLTPLAAMQLTAGDDGTKIFTNPTTGADSRSVTLPQHKIDFAMSSGRFMQPAGSDAWRLAMKDGRAAVRGVYDFCRLNGARAVVEGFLSERGYWQPPESAGDPPTSE